MTMKPVSITAAATLFFTALAGGQAHGSEVASVMALCDANPACSHSVPDKKGRVFFKLQGTTGTKTIQCDWDGRCFMSLPRGQTLSIRDVPAKLLAK